MVLQLQHNTRILFTTTKTGIKKPPVDFLLIFNPKQDKKKARNVQKTAQLQGFLMLCVLSLAELGYSIMPTFSHNKLHLHYAHNQYIESFFPPCVIVRSGKIR